MGTVKKFGGKVIDLWNRIPREVVATLNLSEFKVHLDNALSHMV